MDAIALIKSGYDNTVATLGTAITEHQARIIAKYFKEVVICYDSDTAGRNATNRAITVLRSQNIKISVLNLKGGKDPDEYIKTYGKTRFDAVMNARVSDMAYLIDYFGEDYDLKKPDQVLSYISQLTDYLKLIQSSVELDIYTAMVAEKTGVQQSSISSQLGIKKASSPTVPVGNSDVINVVNKGTAVKDNKDYLEKTRSLLLSTVFYDRKLYDRYSSRINETMFDSRVHLEIYRYIKQCAESGEKFSQSALINRFDNSDDINAVSGILALDVQSDDTDKAVSDYINQINEKAGPERALELLRENKITIEQFNAMINNKG